MRRMRAFILTTEALLSVIAAAWLLSMSHPYDATGLSYRDVYRHQLAQDFAEVSVRSAETREALCMFAAGGNEKELKGYYAELLSRLGGYCLRVGAGTETMDVGCSEGRAFQVTASRALLCGEEFIDVRFTLSFAA
ncbi:Uncharacterised protein [Candidatus Norongarragalina meridionalis]|nr:Uncharacterised protein [Candidatus Norongarragalina meridionalis]